MKHQATRDLFDYWNRLRRGRTAPERADIEPTAIRDVLADTFMLEVDPSQSFPIRLAGTRFNAVFDGEQKGRPFLDLWRAEERRNVAAVLLTVVDGACPVVAGGAIPPDGEGESASFEFLFLPLRHHGKTHARILGIATAAAHRPAWLGLMPPGAVALRSLRIVDQPVAEMDEMCSMPIAVGQRAEPIADRLSPTGSLLFGGGPTMPVRPQLRLIQGGRLH